MKRLAIFFAIAILAVTIFFTLVTKQTKSNQPSVVAPPSKPITIDPMDKSFLKIRLAANHYEASLFEKSITTDRPDSIKNFVTTNKSLINLDKVVVVGNEKMKEFQIISSLLINSGITRFIVNAE